MATTTLKIGGAQVTLSQHDVWPVALQLQAAGISTLTLQRRGGPVVTPASSWLGQAVELRIDGDLVFAGDVVDHDVQRSAFGWVALHQCRDLRNRGDWVPFTDSNTRLDEGTWNLPADDPLYIPGRSGRTIGEVIESALQMADNAANLHALGIGGYVALSPPTLPPATLSDLAALDSIPPRPATISGGKLLSALESYLSSVAPNHVMRVQPDGVIRFLDMRAAAEKTLTLGVDPIEPTPLKISVADCFPRVVVRGSPANEPKLLTKRTGGIVELFAHSGLDNAGAKAAWTPEDFDKDEGARSQGTAVCTDTTTVVLTSNPASQAWAADEWDQTHRMGSLCLISSVIAGVDQYVIRRVASNTVKTAGDASTFTLDAALPSTDYGEYVLYGASAGASFVWRKYKVADPVIAAAVAREFTYPVAWLGANGDSATSTSFPVASVCWSDDGEPPYNEVPVPFSYDADSGALIFTRPTWMAAGGKPPDDVRALLPVNTGSLTAVAPASGYAGDSHAEYGLTKTLVVTVDDWRDPANQTRMEDYAREILDSVKDAVVEGQVAYRGLYKPALAFGIGLSIHAADATTGYENRNVPVTAVEVTWNSGSPDSHVTTMTLSNRRAPLSDGSFLRPERVAASGLATIGSGATARGNIDQITVSPEDQSAAMTDAKSTGRYDPLARKRVRGGRR